jgi:hypothetical protein
MSAGVVCVAPSNMVRLGLIATVVFACGDVCEINQLDKRLPWTVIRIWIIFKTIEVPSDLQKQRNCTMKYTAIIYELYPSTVQLKITECHYCIN